MTLLSIPSEYLSDVSISCQPGPHLHSHQSRRYGHYQFGSILKCVYDLLGWLFMQVVLPTLQVNVLTNWKPPYLQLAHTLWWLWHNVSRLLGWAAYTCKSYLLIAVQRHRPASREIDLVYFSMIWAVVLFTTPAVSNYTGMMVQRFFLGFFESGISPVFQFVSCQQAAERPHSNRLTSSSDVWHILQTEWAKRQGSNLVRWWHLHWRVSLIRAHVNETSSLGVRLFIRYW